MRSPGFESASPCGRDTWTGAVGALVGWTAWNWIEAALDLAWRHTHLEVTATELVAIQTGWRPRQIRITVEEFGVTLVDRWGHGVAELGVLKQDGTYE